MATAVVAAFDLRTQLVSSSVNYDSGIVTLASDPPQQPLNNVDVRAVHAAVEAARASASSHLQPERIFVGGAR